MEQTKIDKPVFFISAAVLLVVSILFLLFPEQSSNIIQKLFHHTLHNFGFIYTWAGILVIVAMLFFSFSYFGKIKFGNTKPEFSTFTWGSLLFTAGIAAALMFWGAIEWVYYYTKPAQGIEAESWLAAEWANTYGIFHWGITAWSFYAICSLPIGYSYFVRETPILKISEACSSILGSKVKKWPGKIIDIFFILSLAFGAATSLSIGVLMVSAAVCSMLNTTTSLFYDLLMLAITTALFAFTGFLGLKKGIAKLSRINSFLALAILVIVFIFGPSLFIIKMTTTSIGLLGNNFFRMSTWMDPVTNGGFPESWTQFYWAWWIAYAPFMGLFIARISRGRSIKNVLLGSMTFGSLGCALFFWVLGNYQMNLQLTGKLDIISLVNSIGASSAIMEGFKMLSVGKLIIALYAICGIMFLATTFNSVSFSFAAVSMKELKQNEDPNRYLILVWAIILALIPAALLALKGPLSTLQSVTVIGSLPLVFIIILEISSFIKMVHQDKKQI